jgi:hypothetical protein
VGAPAAFADASEYNSFMRAIVFIRPIIVLTALAAFGAGAIARPACDPRKADSAVKSVQALNVLKTRTGIPTEQDINAAITFRPLLGRAMIVIVGSRNIGGNADHPIFRTFSCA